MQSLYTACSSRSVAIGIGVCCWSIGRWPAGGQAAVACRSGVFRCNTGNLHIRLDHQMMGSPVLPFRWRLSMKLDTMLYRLHSQLEQEKEEKEKRRKERLSGDDSLAISIMRCQKT